MHCSEYCEKNLIKGKHNYIHLYIYTIYIYIYISDFWFGFNNRVIVETELIERYIFIYIYRYISVYITYVM